MKKLLVLITIVASVVMARADILYWMVDTNSAGDFDYDMVNLMYNGERIDSFGYADVSEWGSSLNESLVALQQTYPVDLLKYELNSSYVGGTFWVELMNGTDFVAESMQKYTLEQLAGHISKGGIGVPPTAATFGAFAIPEPTSGLLFLMGGILLGLKRRRMA